MSPETLELIRHCLTLLKEAAIVILPAAITGYFALKAGRRDAKLELAKLKAEHEFAARNRFYDYLKDQQTRIRSSHETLAEGIEKVLVGYHQGMAKIDGVLLESDEAAEEKAKAIQMLSPLLETFAYSLRSQSRAMRDERDSLLRYYQEHRAKDTVAIEELQSLQFPEVDVTSARTIEIIRDTAYRLIEVNRAIANHGHRALQADIEAQLQRYFT